MKKRAFMKGNSHYHALYRLSIAKYVSFVFVDGTSLTIPKFKEDTVVFGFFEDGITVDTESDYYWINKDNLLYIRVEKEVKENGEGGDSS